MKTIHYVIPAGLQWEIRRAEPYDIIEVSEGVVPGPIIVDRPLTIKAGRKWASVISGGNGHGIHIKAPKVTLDGLQISGPLYSGVKVEGDTATITECWINHARMCGVEGHQQTGLCLRRCLIERCGTHPNLHHGVYADGGYMRIEACIVRYNAAIGIAAGEDCRRSLIDWCTVHNNGTYGIGIWRKGGQPNQIINCTIAFNPVQAVRIHSTRDGEKIAKCVFYRNGIKDGTTILNGNKRRLDIQECHCYPEDGMLVGFPEPVMMDAPYQGRFYPKETTGCGAWMCDPTRLDEDYRVGWESGWPYMFAADKAPPDSWTGGTA